MGKKTIFLFLILFLVFSTFPVFAIDLDNLNFHGSVNFPETTEIISIRFDNDGDRLYLADNTNGHSGIFNYNLSQAYNISTRTFNFYLNSSEMPNRFLNRTNRIIFNDVGTKLYLYDAFKGLYSYNMSPTYDLISLGEDKNITLNRNTLWWRNNGNTFYTLNIASRTFSQYTASTSYDIGSLAFVGNYNFIFPLATTPNDIMLNAVGTELYVLTTGDGTLPEAIYRFDLATPFTLSTASYNDQLNLTDYLTRCTNPEECGFWTNDNQDLWLVGGEDSIFIYTTEGVTPSTPSEAQAGSIGDISATIDNLFPDSDSLTLTQRLSYVAIVMIGLLAIILVPIMATKMDIGKPLFFIVAGIEMLVFFYFVAIGYVPMTLLIVVIMAFLGLFYLGIRGRM